MVKVIKYISEVPGNATTCSENHADCNIFSGSVHVCFEDGSGATVCKSCFESCLDEGVWTADSTIRLAS